MQPTVEATRDPVRPLDPPPVDQLGLDYRVRSPFVRSDRAHAIGRISYFCVGSVLIVLGLRYVTYLFSGFSADQVLAVVTALGLGFGMLLVLGNKPWSVVLVGTLAGSGVWLVALLTASATSNLVLALLLYLMALLCVAGLADGVATHYALWLNAHPQRSHKKRLAWQTLWKTRYQNLWILGSVARIAGRTPELQREIGLYPIGFVPLCGSLLLTLLFFLLVPKSPVAGMCGLLLATILLIIATCFWVFYRQPDPTLPLRVTRDALVSWLSYNRASVDAPGVFQSPWGSIFKRCALTYLTIFLLAAALLPLSTYFPVALLVSGPKPWLALQQSSEKTSQASQKHHEGPIRLTPLQKRYFEQLSQQKRSEYLRALRERRTALARVEAAIERRQQSLARFTATPETWLTLAFDGVFNGKVFFLVALMISLLACVLFPALLLVLSSLALCGRPLAAFYRTLEASHEASWDPPSWQRWQTYVRRLNELSHNGQAPERDHLWLGTNSENDYPVLLHRPMLQRHGWILGDSGSGKTALALSPLVAQLTRLGDCSILILDLKGDPTLFHGARLEAQAAGLPFQWFTTRREDATYVFNPFTQSHLGELTLNQRVQILMQALGLEYGEFYGKGYFSGVNENVLRNLLRTYEDIDSFRRLQFYSQEKSYYRATKGREKEWLDATGLISVIDRLAEMVPLNITAAAGLPQEVLEAQIDLPSLATSPRVVYFYLPSLLETVSVRGVAKLALYTLLTSVFLRQGKTKPSSAPRDIVVVIDEFQQIVAYNLEIVLRQARSMGVGAILANQNITDLTQQELDLVPTVEANTAFKQILAASSLAQRDYLVKSSGETIYDLYSETVNHRGHVSMTRREQLGPRYGPNDIIEMSAEQTQSMVGFSHNSGLTRFSGFNFQMTSDFHISREEYQRRENLSWPQRSPETFVAKDVLFDDQPGAVSSKDPGAAPIQGQMEFKDDIASHLEKRKARHEQVRIIRSKKEERHE